MQEITDRVDSIETLLQFVKELNKMSLMPLIEELELEPSPFSVYYRLIKEDWEKYYGLPGIYIYNELHKHDKGMGIRHQSID